MDALSVDLVADWKTWGVLAGIAVVVYLYATERFSIELVSLFALTGPAHR